MATVLSLSTVPLAATPTLHAFVVEGPVVWLSLRAADAGAESWVRLGGDFDGYRVERWNGADQTVTLRRGDAAVDVPLARAAVQKSVAGAAAATRQVLDNLHHLTVSACQWMLSHETSQVGVEELVGPEQSLRQIEPAEEESYAGLSFTATPAGVHLVMDGESIHALSGSERFLIQAGPTQSLEAISRRLGIPLEALTALNPGLTAERQLAEWTSVRLH